MWPESIGVIIIITTKLIKILTKKHKKKEAIVKY